MRLKPAELKGTARRGPFRSSIERGFQGWGIPKVRNFRSSGELEQIRFFQGGNQSVQAPKNMKNQSGENLPEAGLFHEKPQ